MTQVPAPMKLTVVPEIEQPKLAEPSMVSVTVEPRGGRRGHVIGGTANHAPRSAPVEVKLIVWLVLLAPMVCV